MRYLQKVPMLISSNIPEVVNLLKNKFMLKEEEITFKTDILKAKIVYQYQYRKNSKYERYLDNSFIFMGQVESDTSLMDINRKRGVKISDFKEELSEKAKGYKHILYKGHPFASADHRNRQIKFLRKTIKKDVIKIDYNAYEMFAISKRCYFTGISSGSLMEAKQFGVESKTLIDFPFETSIERNNCKFVLISLHYFFSPKFWGELLGDYLEVKNYFDSYDNEEIMSHPDSISKSFEKILDSKIRNYNMMAKLKRKRVFINLICSFIPSKKIRKKIRLLTLNIKQ